MSTKNIYYNNNGVLSVKTVAVKPLNPEFVRIEPKALAGNPIDQLHLDLHLADGTAAGTDVAGVVTEVGANVTNVAVGDHVAAMVSGGDIDDLESGAFSTSVDARADALLRFKNLSFSSQKSISAGPITTFEQASGIPLLIYTVAFMFQIKNGTPIVPNSASGYVLIYGAGTGVGFVAIQLAKYVGYTVIATAAKKHHEVLKSIGADHLIDYHDSDWIEQARSISGDSIIAAFDTVSHQDTWNQVSEVVSRTAPAKIHNVTTQLSAPSNLRKNVEWTSTNIYQLFLAQKQFGPALMPGVPAIFAKRAEISERLNKYLSTSKFVAPSDEIVGNSFDEVPQLYEALRKGASGNRFVVRLGN